MCENVKHFVQSLFRRKKIGETQISHTGENLARCLTTLDLIAIGIGSTLGLGVYVLAGEVARTNSGPSVALSFFIAAVASVLAGLCYAEFGARVPRAGSAYAYSYVTVGELVAFIMGWTLILTYVIGTASVAKGYSRYLDSLTNNEMEKNFRNLLEIDVVGLAAYPDIFAFSLVCLLTCLLGAGVKESTRFNNIFTVINIIVIIFVVVAGLYKADTHNWNVQKDEIPEDVNGGEGGFFPFGIAGMLAGSATCFYGFIGFDVVATTGEEAKNPQKSIPISIVVSLLCVFLAYFGVSCTLTLMVPYYAQDADAPIPSAFEYVGWPVAKVLVTIGALAGLTTSLLGSLFPLPRILYVMAVDGLIFKFLAKVHKRFKTPLISTLLSGLLAAILAAIFELRDLVNLMSIGTLLTYTLVALSVIILRYSEEQTSPATNPAHRGDTDAFIVSAVSVDKTANYISQYFNTNRIKIPNATSSKLSTVNSVILVVALIAFDIVLVFGVTDFTHLPNWALLLLVVFGFVIFSTLLSLTLQPNNPTPVSFKVPFVPFLPTFSLLINIYLMLSIPYMIWIRFLIWVALGLVIYFGYGIRHSAEGSRKLAAEVDTDESGKRSTGMTSPTEKSSDFSLESKTFFLNGNENDENHKNFISREQYEEIALNAV